MIVADAAALPANSPSDIAAQLRKCPTGLQEEQLLQLSRRALACGYSLTAALAMGQLSRQMQQAEAWQWARQCSGAATSVEPFLSPCWCFQLHAKALLYMHWGAVLPLDSWASMTLYRCGRVLLHPMQSRPALWAASKLVFPVQHH